MRGKPNLDYDIAFHLIFTPSWDILGDILSPFSDPEQIQRGPHPPRRNKLRPRGGDPEGGDKHSKRFLIFVGLYFSNVSNTFR